MALEIAVIFRGNWALDSLLNELHKVHALASYLVFDTQSLRSLPNLHEVKTICENGDFK